MHKNLQNIPSYFQRVFLQQITCIFREIAHKKQVQTPADALIVAIPKNEQLKFIG
ncbi:hypothetical protein [Microbulbifer sp. 2205BS26-8]|uniref:hypothetical protein n=1 Tax=Microbulbifer sp. 2205BS26-8 TaxID=3064386 RepID=UPI00273D55BD|nr:hypothetical protein [Microbulbifer sp. 2205BS26-8]MDP5208746.1 hypothetical protein [Microbulbifer sp. 2205BS26-8]